MVLVVNDSLKMTKGKIAAQAGHATLACALMLKEVNPKVSHAGWPTCVLYLHTSLTLRPLTPHPSRLSPFTAP